jgi:hypothetical protein
VSAYVRRVMNAPITLAAFRPLDRTRHAASARRKGRYERFEGLLLRSYASMRARGRPA